MSTAAHSSPAQSARTRQIVYALAVVVLFGVMWPYTDWLQKVKRDTDLGEATIGQIDTASFAVKLAMVGGFRGLVANYLWTRAEELKKQHEWDDLMATVEMITKLQPHFLSVWTFQSWNLAYNVSVEWDAPEDKYEWIKRGILFVRDGVSKNTHSPDLLWDTAWYYYHKLGFADEAILLRGLFYRDPDDDGKNFKVDPVSGEPKFDNFQVAKGWFTRSVQLVDSGASRLDAGVEGDIGIDYVDKQPQRKGRPGDLNFRSMPAHAQTRYASALEKMSTKDVEPLFGQIAQAEWDQAIKDWDEFGLFPFPAFNNEKELIHIGYRVDPERYKALSPNQQYWTDRWADQMNFRYWRDRCSAEAEPQGVNARQLFYEGTMALRNADYPAAVEKYKLGIELWKNLLERHTTYRDDDLNKKDTGHVVKRYVFALKNAGEAPPEDMPFKELYEAVKDDVYLDPFDQLDMMRTPPKKSALETRR